MTANWPPAGQSVEAPVGVHPRWVSLGVVLALAALLFAVAGCASEEPLLVRQGRALLVDPAADAVPDPEWQERRRIFLKNTDPEAK